MCLFIYFSFCIYVTSKQKDLINTNIKKWIWTADGETKRNADGTNQCQVNIPTVRTELNMVPTVGRKMVQHSTGYPCTGPSAPPNLWGFMDFAFVPKGGSK